MKSYGEIKSSLSCIKVQLVKYRNISRKKKKCWTGDLAYYITLLSELKNIITLLSLSVLSSNYNYRYHFFKEPQEWRWAPLRLPGFTLVPSSAVCCGRRLQDDCVLVAFTNAYSKLCFLLLLSIDVTEVQIFIIIMYLLAAVGGSAFWQSLVIVIGSNSDRLGRHSSIIEQWCHRMSEQVPSGINTVFLNLDLCSDVYVQYNYGAASRSDTNQKYCCW